MNRSKILSGQQLDAKNRILSIKSQINDLQNKLHQAKSACTHVVNPPKEEWLSVSCEICGQDFGWYCPESPDCTCHYFSTETDTGRNAVKLLDGAYVFLPELNTEDYNPDWETEDCCLFCGESDERK